mmetsp:Transcript_40718/g.96831  ORF Transcript_40718/g.96831 Transcript_40718/m.96831 type:complete len:214 (+) Transcript_40718:557-1198(+)
MLSGCILESTKRAARGFTRTLSPRLLLKTMARAPLLSLSACTALLQFGSGVLDGADQVAPSSWLSDRHTLSICLLRKKAARRSDGSSPEGPVRRTTDGCTRPVPLAAMLVSPDHVCPPSLVVRRALHCDGMCPAPFGVWYMGSNHELPSWLRTGTFFRKAPRSVNRTLWSLQFRPPSLDSTACTDDVAWFVPLCDVYISRILSILSSQSQVGF